MTSARRLIAAVSLAAGAAALATPAAQAAPQHSHDTASPSLVSTLDTLGESNLPEEQRGKVPGVESQLGGLQQLNQLHQLTDLVAPVTNALPAVQ
ncbi:hypothetical protein [Streptomyces sp. NPDC047123]|uniref:hypothetical protein n=1 Tax=unclassified Streptomyces TaxID=2593676 RepID=UPI0033F632CF